MNPNSVLKVLLKLYIIIIGCSLTVTNCSTLQTVRSGDLSTHSNNISNHYQANIVNKQTLTVLLNRHALKNRTHTNITRIRRDDDASTVSPDFAAPTTIDTALSSTESSDQESSSVSSGSSVTELTEDQTDSSNDNVSETTTVPNIEADKEKDEDEIVVKKKNSLNNNDEDDTDESDNDDDENEDDDDDDEDDEDDDDEDDVLECDYSTSAIVRNINTTVFLPEDYHELSEHIFEADLSKEVDDLSEIFSIGERLSKYFSRLATDNDLQKSFKYLSSVMSDQLFKAKLEPQCTSDLYHMAMSVKNLQFWALKFPDSWGSINPSGLLTGVLSSFGDFDQCISIKSPPLNNNRHIYGRYCQVQLRFPLPDIKHYQPDWENEFMEHQRAKYTHPVIGNYTQRFINQYGFPVIKTILQASTLFNRKFVNYGICIPSSCSIKELETLINAFIYPFFKIPAVIETELCTDHPELQTIKLDNFQIFAILVLSALIIITLVSTFYHQHLLNLKRKAKRLNNNKKKNNHAKEYLSKNGTIELDRQLEYNNSSSSNNNNNNNLNSDEKTITIEKEQKQQELSISYKKLMRKNRILLCFSLISSWSKLSATCRDDDRNAVIDSIRIFLTFMLFFVQSYLFTAAQYTSLRNLFVEYPYGALEQIRYFPGHLPSAWYDGFMFVMCCTLMITQYRRITHKNYRFNYGMYVAKRWLRLSAPLFGSILFIYLFPLTGDGPLWHQNERWLVHPCRQWPSLVSSFLYYSNWNPSLNDYELVEHLPICNLSSWILSVSTQIYLVLPLIFFSLYLYPKKGIIILGTITILSPLAITYPKWALDLPTFHDLLDYERLNPSGIYQRLVHYQINTLQYITPSCIGLITGWLILEHPKLKIAGGRRAENWLFVVSIVACLAFVWWNDTFWQLEEKCSQLNILSWFVLSKFLWPMTLGYFVFMTHTGRAPKVKKLLTIRFLQPISKMSLCIYLVRIMMIWHRSTTVRQTHVYFYFTAIQNIFVDFALSIFYGLILYLLFEAPALAFIKYLDDRTTRHKEQKEDSFKKIDPDNVG